MAQDKITKNFPTGFIAWNNTCVSMTIDCKCGCQFHFHEDFAYYVKCPSCNTIYKCSQYIELTEIKENPEGYIIELDEENISGYRNKR